MAQETGYATPEEMRAKALKRLAVAGAVTAAALGALWWLDQGDAGRSPARKPAVKPAPITAAAPPASDPAAPVETPAPLPAAAPSTTASPAAAPATAGAGTPPPPQVNNAPLAPPRPGVGPAPGAAQSPVLVGAFASQPATETFVVQVGIYHDAKAAQDLVRRLGKLGVKARLETRVQVGPFASKAEADKALEALRRQGLNGVVAVPEAPSAASRR